VLFQELSALVGEAVELPGVALPTLVVFQDDLLYNIGVNELLDILGDDCVAHAGIEFREFVH